MMRGLLTPAAKAPGLFNVVGYVTRNTPLENVRDAYQYAREYGTLSFRTQ